MYDLELGRKKLKEFKEKYYKEHSLCPVCRHDKHTSTYVGYILKISADYKVDESYKDENRVKCRCGWVGICHDLIGE